jgi:hypothetical protein
MSMPEQAGKVATGTIEALKTQPLALALIIINVMYLIAGGLFVREVGKRLDVRNERFDKLVEHCMAAQQSGEQK